jgi:hypothetical protein
MATTESPTRPFEIVQSPVDGLVRIRRADTGRVTLALNVEEASQIRAGIKGALQSTTKKRSKKDSKKRRARQGT